MKKINKLVALVLSASALASMGACRRENLIIKGGTKGELDIVIHQGLGYGETMLKEIAEDFENVTGNKVNVQLVSNAEAGNLFVQLEAGSYIGDLAFLNNDSFFKKLLTPAKNGGKIAHDITQTVMNQKPDGEDKTVVEKLTTYHQDAYRWYDGHYYAVPYLMESCSMVYNKTTLNELFGEGNWELPKTTNEMMALADDIRGDKPSSPNAYAFCWSGVDSYWSFIYNSWWAQYQGYENYKQSQEGYYWNEDTNAYEFAQNAENISSQTGLLRAAEVMAKIIPLENGYSHPTSLNMPYLNAQAAFADYPYGNITKSSVFMPNGDWLYGETLKYIQAKKQDIGFMRMPIISSIVETLDLYEDGSASFESLSANKQSAYDTALRAAIDYVDDGMNGEKPTYKGKVLSDGDIAKIKEARQMMFGLNKAYGFIPYTCPAVDVSLAEEFLVFFASNRSIVNFANNCYGLSPFTLGLDETAFASIQTSMNSFEKEVLDIVVDTPVKIFDYHTMMRTTSMTYTKGGEPGEAFWDGGKTAQSWFDATVVWGQQNWKTWVKNAGLSDLLN